MTNTVLIILMAGGFGSIAGLMAFIITYGEYEHHYPTKKEPIKIALQSGFLAFVVFLYYHLVLYY